jgi:hypothetical protein
MKTTETTKHETPALSDAELDKAAGGVSNNILSRTTQAKNDMQKGIIANFRV